MTNLPREREAIDSAEFTTGIQPAINPYAPGPVTDTRANVSHRITALLPTTERVQPGSTAFSVMNHAENPEPVPPPPPMPVFSAQPMMQQTTTPAPTSRNIDFSPHAVTSGLVRSAGIGAGVAGAATAGFVGTLAVNSGTPLLTSAILASAAALPYAASGLVYGATTYGLGLLHNAVWQREDSKTPGLLGTFARGLVAPLTVPVGILRNLTWNRKK